MINDQIWELLEDFYSKNQKIKCANVKDEDILAAEKLLKLQFSDLYRYYLKNHAISKIGKFLMNNLGLDHSVIAATQDFKNTKQYLEFNSHYIIALTENNKFIGCGMKGDICVIDADKPIKHQIAENFEKFLEIALSEVIVEV